MTHATREKARADVTRQEFGDWQTPIDLARSALDVIESMFGEPKSVIEPTCGEGTFLRAAAERFPRTDLIGYEINPTYARRARAALGKKARIHIADFFTVEWERVLAEPKGPILVTGNPPWVTNAALGAIGSSNLPAKRNDKGLSGLDARTGKSNFDVSEWMLRRLIEACRGRDATVAVLCKAAVARRIIEQCQDVISPGGLWRIDTKRHFDAAVDAVLFACKIHKSTSVRGWPVRDSLDAHSTSSTIAVVDGTLVADSARWKRTAHLAGTMQLEWRSGLKHDCARVMELEHTAGGWQNGLGERVEIEDDIVYPLLKGSDVNRGNALKQRAVVVPQRALGEDTGALAREAPKAWAYLRSHRELLGARKSSIYRGQPAFAIFGIGPYSFAPFKVAISALHKRCAFQLVEPANGRPVMLDDTCYFLPFDSRDQAERALVALSSPLAQDFFHARIFWDEKRPINKGILQRLDLEALDQK